MAAAVPFIAQVVVSVLVSKVATSLAEKLGFSDGFSQIIGMAAGIYAGVAVGGAMSPKTAGGEAGLKAPELANLDVAAGGGGAVQPVAPSTAITPGMGAPGPSGGLTESLGGAGGGGGGGILTQGAVPPGTLPSGGIVPSGKFVPKPEIVQPSVAKNVISETVGGAGENAGESYWKKLFSPERLVDMAAGGIKGAADYQTAKEDREYPEEVVRRNAADWLNRGTSGLSQIRLKGPGQGYLSSYQQ